MQEGSWWSGWGQAKQWVQQENQLRQKQYFRVAHTIDLGLNDEPAEQAWLFGHQFDTNQEARLLYSSTLWFTYRENIRFPQSMLTSDVGWGCMLRVGQMMLAEVLRRAAGIDNYGDPNTIERLIGDFMDEKGKYSIQRMVKRGLELYGKGAGEWFTPAETAFLLRDIQNSIPDSPLRVMVFHGEFEAASARAYLSSSHRDKRQPAKLQSSQASIQPGLIVVLVRIGVGEPQEEMLKSVLEVMKLPAFAGILGGRPGKAHYIVGATARNFIYLDPHCVKQEKVADEFFCPNMFSMAHGKVDTSMGLCFFVGSYEELTLLSDALQQLTSNQAFYSHSKQPQPKLVELTSDPIQILE